jgi:hypothetical protein
MHKNAISILLCSSLLGLSVTAWSAGHMDAGLWEMSVKSDPTANMPANLPPAILEKMRQMGPIAVKVCISKEMANRDQPPPSSHDADCQKKNFLLSGNSYSADIVCDGANFQGQGTVTGTFVSRQSFSSTSDMKGTSHGRQFNQHAEISGKWLSADCGDVKPIDSSAAK